MQQYLLFLVTMGAAVLIPGPDTLVVLRTALADGARAGIWAAAGSASGNVVWGVASVLGLTALLTVSPPAFAALKIAGAAYLVVLGVRAVASWRGRVSLVGPETPAATAAGAFRGGLASDLANVKVGLFWTALVPQFLEAEHGVALPAAMIVTSGIVVFGWLTVYALLAGRLRPALGRPRVSRAVHGTVAVVFFALAGQVLLV